MRNLTVRDVMTTEVHAVRETTPFKEIAQLLATYRVSAVPVVDDEQGVLGVVSEVDLLPKQVHPGRDWSALLGRRRHRASGRVARDLMRSPAITIFDDATVVECARKLEHHRIKRLPVVDRDGTLVGIVSRADLVRIFIRDDDELRAEIEHEVFEQVLGLRADPTTISVEVAGGVVTLAGELERKSDVPIAMSLTRRIPGVVDVVDHVTFGFDDTHLRPTDPTNYGITHELWHNR